MNVLSNPRLSFTNNFANCTSMPLDFKFDSTGVGTGYGPVITAPLLWNSPNPKVCNITAD